MASSSSENVIYQFKVHKAANLPKADLFGKIDPFVKIILPDAHGHKVLQTPHVMHDYDPKFKVVLTGAALKGQITVEVWDYDKMGGDEAVGSFTIDSQSMPFQKVAFPLILHEKFKHKVQHEGVSSLTLSCGYIIPYGALKAKLHQVPGVVCDDGAEQIVTNFHHPGFAQPLSLSIKYQPESVDISLSISTPGPKAHGLSFLIHSFKCIMKRKSSTVHAVGGDGSWDYMHLPLYAPFGALQFWETDIDVIKSETTGTLVAEHGWHGKMNYVQARAGLKNILPDDNNEVIYFFESHIALKVHWNPKNFSIETLVFSKTMEDGILCDFNYLPSPSTSHTYAFLGKPTPLGPHHVSLRIALDGVQNPALESHKLVLYRTQNIQPVSILTYLPLNG